MLIQFVSSWPSFCVAFGGMLFLILIMKWQSTRFYTQDVVLRKFSIMELEMPATQMELVNLIKGLYDLPPATSAATVKALKGQLYTDFLFMPFAYGAILLLCMQLSNKISFSWGTNVFMVLAFLQLLAWLCDIVENIYLLNKIKPTVVASTLVVHKAYLSMECVKWGIALISTISAVAAICYFWLTGSYSFSSLYYLVIILGEVAVFFIVSSVFFKKKDIAL